MRLRRGCGALSDEEVAVTGLHIGRRALGATALASLATAPLARAQSGLASPTQAPLLTVSGKISNRNRGDTAVFDRPMLDALGISTIVTRTPWYDGPVRFDGVLMAKLMEVLGVTGNTVTALALNDYSTDIPVGDFTRYGVLLATLRNGAPMPVSDKGPLFIVYPYDTDSELRTRQYYARSAWSVAQLIVR
jgi:hypothetical protein